MWKKIKASFGDSETIIWARVQMVLGGAIELLASVDPNLFAPVLGDYFPYFLIINGFMTEYLRRRRADDL